MLCIIGRAALAPRLATCHSRAAWAPRLRQSGSAGSSDHPIRSTARRRPAFAHNTTEHPHLLNCQLVRCLKLDDATSFLAKAQKFDNTINRTDWKYMELRLRGLGLHQETVRRGAVRAYNVMHSSRPSLMVCQGYAGALKRFGRMHGSTKSSSPCVPTPTSSRHSTLGISTYSAFQTSGNKAGTPISAATRSIEAANIGTLHPGV